MTDSAFRELLRDGEDDRKAFITSLNEYDVIAQAVCAFMNGEGGTIICGVEQNGNIVGIPDRDLQLLNALENRLQHDITPKPSMTINSELVASDATNKQLVLISVPAGLDTPYMFEGRMLLRKGTSLVPADSYELRACLQRRNIQPTRWERRQAPTLELSDLSADEILKTARTAAESNLYYFKNKENAESILEELTMSGPNGLTNAADVSFARDPSSRNPQCQARILYYTTDKIARSGIRDRHFSGPITQIYEQMLDAIRSVLTIRSNFPPEQSEREDRPDFAFEAVREGLINALAHRDYANFSGGLTVSIYPGRIEIWNSGRLPQELDAKNLAQISRSLPVNPDISRVLHFRRLMEKIGRGTRLIAEESRRLGAKLPKWEDKPSGVTLTIFAAPIHELAALPLKPRQEAAVRDIRPGQTITPASYRSDYAPDVSERQARRDMKEIEEEGYFVREKGGHSSAYRRTDLALNTKPNRT